MLNKVFRNRSRSPGGNTRSGGFGSALGLLQLEQSPIEPNQNTPKIFNTVRKLLLNCLNLVRPEFGMEFKNALRLRTEILFFRKIRTKTRTHISTCMITPLSITKASNKSLPSKNDILYNLHDLCN